MRTRVTSVATVAETQAAYLECVEDPDGTVIAYTYHVAGHDTCLACWARYQARLCLDDRCEQHWGEAQLVRPFLSLQQELIHDHDRMPPDRRHGPIYVAWKLTGRWRFDFGDGPYPWLSRCDRLPDEDMERLHDACRFALADAG